MLRNLYSNIQERWNNATKGELDKENPHELVIGHYQNGVIIPNDDVDTEEPLQDPISFNKRVEYSDLNVATFHPGRMDEMFAVMWSDFRTSRPHVIPTQQRLLDCCISKVIYSSQYPSSPFSTIMSCTDGYDHPIEDREQQHIATISYLATKRIIQEFESHHNQLIYNSTESGEPPSRLSYEELLQIYQTIQSKTAEDQAQLGIDGYVGLGNVTTLAYPVITNPNLIQKSSSLGSTIFRSRASVGIVDPSAFKYHYEVVTCGVGDCCALAFLPNEDFRCIVLYQPVEFRVNGTKSTYRPASVTSLQSHEFEANCVSLPPGAIIVQMTDGVWNKFTKEAVKDEKFLQHHSTSAVCHYLRYELDIEKLQSILRTIPPDALTKANIILGVLLMHTSEVAETERSKLANALQMLQLYRTSPSFQAENFIQSEGGKRPSPKSWYDSKDLLPKEVQEASEIIKTAENFNDEVPTLSLLEYCPKIGDDCTLMVQVLAPFEVQLSRMLIESATHRTSQAKQVKHMLNTCGFDSKRTMKLIEALANSTKNSHAVGMCVQYEEGDDSGSFYVGRVKDLGRQMVEKYSQESIQSALNLVK